MRKRFAGFLILALCLPLLLIPAKAAGTEADLVTLDRARDIVISVLYDGAEPGITLYSPDGRAYAADSDYAAVERGGGAVYFYIEDAAAGTWRVRVEKRDSSDVEVSVYPWDRPASIDSLTVTGVENGNVVFEAVVSGHEGSFRYDVYALPVKGDGSLGGRVDLGSSSGRNDTTLRLRQSVSQLPDGEYRLGLEVYFTTDSGAEVPTFAISDDTFTVSGSNIPGDPGDLDAVMDITGNTLELTWTDDGTRMRSWTVEVRPVSDPEAVYFQAELDGGVMSCSVVLDRDVGDLNVTVTGEKKSSGWLVYERTVPWDAGIDIAFETPELTNSTMGTLRFDVKDRTVSAVLDVNGNQQELRLTGAQALSFQLSPMSENEVSLTYEGADGVRYRLSRRITVDSVPPALDLFGVPDTISVSSSSVTLAGSTEPGARLTVNGEEVELDSAGGFRTEARLSAGENILTFEASDAAGNKSVRTLTVLNTSAGAAPSSQSGSGVPWILIVTAGASALAVGLMAAFGAVTSHRVKKEQTQRAGLLRKLFAVLEGLLLAGGICAAAAAAALTVYADKMAGSISGGSLASALQNMSAGQFAERAARVREIRAQALWAVVAGVAFLLGMILLMVLMGFIKRKLAHTPDTPKAPKAPKQGPADAGQTPGHRFCTSCGARLTEDTDFCPNCGAKLK